MSFALNQRPGVSEETRRRVVEYAKTMGYDFSRVKAAPTQSKSIFLIHYVRNFHEDMPFFSLLINAMERVLIPTEYTLTVFNLDASEDVPKDYLGRVAVQRLISLMEPGEWHPMRMEAGTSLVLRESTLNL